MLALPAGVEQRRRYRCRHQLPHARVQAVSGWQVRHASFLHQILWFAVATDRSPSQSSNSWWMPVPVWHSGARPGVLPLLPPAC
jgi:hypothetical protein